MLNQTRIVSIAIAIFFIFVAGITFAQEEPEKKTEKTKEKEHHHMEGDIHKPEGMGIQEESVTESKSIVREGEIDLAVIDEDGDSKVYQDQMCWNVVSDEAGECPKCGMKLKEVSLEDAKKNLEENGYEVK